jgi:CelD/BcsL family acetyltransferase involved in cellulose biosynthesis
VGDRYAFFNSGFDPDLSRLRPGVLMQAAVIEAAFEEGAAEFDLLLGDESYKQRFADGSRTVSDVVVSRAPPHPAWLAASGEHVARNVGRRLPDSVKRLVRRRSLLGGRRR